MAGKRKRRLRNSAGNTQNLQSRAFAPTKEGKHMVLTAYSLSFALP
jgi:hypothetical protein